MSCEKDKLNVWHAVWTHTQSHTLLLLYLLAHDCIDRGAVPDLLLGHHNGPLLFPEYHEGVQWLLDVRLRFLLLAEMLRQTAKKSSGWQKVCERSPCKAKVNSLTLDRTHRSDEQGSRVEQRHLSESCKTPVRSCKDSDRRSWLL